MKSGQIFWGFVFVTIGVLILAAKFDWFYLDLGYALDFWPVLLILWGGFILAKRSAVKPFLAVLFGILTGLLVYGTFASITNFDFWDNHWDSRVEWRNERDNNYKVAYDNSIEKAYLDLNAGAGKISVRRTTDELIYGYSQGDQIDYDFSSTNSGNTAYLNFNMEDTNFQLFEHKIDNRLELRLNDNPVWYLDLKIGAARGIFELEDFKIEELNLKTGATDIELRLGDKLERSDIKVDMGAANLEIYIPKESGCRINGKMFLIGKDFDGFRKRNGIYETGNFDEADNKIYLEIHGAVSHVEVKRY